MPPAEPVRYGVVVPVKQPAIAKTRLADVGDRLRRELVVAFALDTVEAVLRSSLVDLVLVTSDAHDLAQDAYNLGAHVVPDATTDDLNASLVQAAAELGRRRPGLGVMALCADLPALRTEELDRVLRAASGFPGRASFVTDEDRVGTTALLAPSASMLAPRFGQDSARAHASAGAAALDTVDVPSLRRDVDTLADLRTALRLGVGPRTTALAEGQGLRRPGLAGSE